MEETIQINTLKFFVPNEIEIVAVVENKDVEFDQMIKNVDLKISRDQYPFSICVDGMASR
ncbi:MAG: hypothetical protein ACTSQ8_15590 [Candidatus Helarchaeota archaeon]